MTCSRRRNVGDMLFPPDTIHFLIIWFSLNMYEQIFHIVTVFSSNVKYTSFNELLLKPFNNSGGEMPKGETEGYGRPQGKPRAGERWSTYCRLHYILLVRHPWRTLDLRRNTESVKWWWWYTFSHAESNPSCIPHKAINAAQIFTICSNTLESGGIKGIALVLMQQNGWILHG